MDARQRLVDLLLAAWLRDAGPELERLGVGPAEARRIVDARVPETGVEVRSSADGIAIRTTSRPRRR